MLDDGRPVVLVLTCDQATNAFVWMPFRGDRRGLATDADLKIVNMWGEQLRASYKTVLRGSEQLDT